MEEYIELDEFMRQQQKNTPYMAQAGEKLMTVEQYAKETGMEEATVRYNLRCGKLLGVKLGSVWRVRVALNDKYDLMAENVQLKAKLAIMQGQLTLIKNALAITDADNSLGLCTADQTGGNQ